MKKLVKSILIVSLLLVCINTIEAEDSLNGYSEWSETKTNIKGEISRVEYGRKVPVEWSEYSYDYPSSEDVKSKDGQVRHYAYDNQNYIWNDVDEKTLFTWDFGYSQRITYFYADVDTYYDVGYTNYEAPPLQLYCDGEMIASIGKHNELENWSPTVNNSCRYLSLKMSSNYGNNRNRTSIVGTWASTGSTMYAYVTKWSEGQDFRTDKEYTRVYGENGQIPVSRIVYSHPIEYKITYDLDGGEFIGDPIYSYTVIDEVILPSASKLGYEFLGFYDGDTKIEKIDVGTYKDIHLVAKYKRKAPTLYIGYTSFEESKHPLTISEVLFKVKASAMDELDKDISKDIKIASIEYDDGEVVNNPEELDVSKANSVIIDFYVINSGNIKASLKRKYYILKEGEEINPYNDELKIYSRYISEEYLDTLDSDSIWLNDDYKNELLEVFEKMKGE